MFKKMRFWDTKVGKILSFGIHEHNSGVGLAKGNISLAIRMLKDSENYTVEDAIERLEVASKSLKKCTDSIDYIYNNLKNIEEEKCSGKEN